MPTPTRRLASGSRALRVRDAGDEMPVGSRKQGPALEYLKRPAGPAPRRRSAVRAETVRPGIQRMLKSFDRTPR